MSGRAVTFAGALDPGDFTVSEDGQSVTIGGVTPRSPRPYKLESTGWNANFAGQGIQEVLAEAGAFVAEASGFLPGHDLEVWSLPVVTVEFDFLLTPAGEWPPEQP